MTGTTDTDVVQSGLAEPDAAPRSDSTVLTPTWLDRLVRTGDGDPSEDGSEFTLEHVQGPPATVARIHGAIGRAVAAMDPVMERDACWKLAQHLASNGFDYAAAIEFGRRALTLGADDAQRRQLATWLESTGDLQGAANAIEPTAARVANVREAARLLVHQARLLMRAGRGAAALDGLLKASAVWPSSADALDLAGELAASLDSHDSASMLLEAADRHEARGDKAGAFEARRRAFELAPSAVQTAEALVASLDRTSRWDAADAVLRSHANATPLERRRDVHRQRFVRALERGQAPLALAAVCDASLEGAVDDAAADAVDGLLETAGLHDLLAVRQLLRARHAKGSQRAAAWAALAALYMGRLASPDRALDAWIEALSAEPSHAQARSALRGHSRTMHDPTPLAEALLRAALTVDDDAEATDCLRELAVIAEERLTDPSLAHWAYEMMGRRGATGDDIDTAKQRLAPRVRLQDAALNSAREALAAAASQEGRIESLRRIASILRGRPGESDEYLDALRQLLEAGQLERRWWVDFERVARRSGRLDLLDAVVRSRLQAGPTRGDRVHFRMVLAEAALQRGDLRGALDEARALIHEVPGVRPAGAFAWAVSSLLDDQPARADAIEEAAATLTTSVRATLYAIAGELHLVAGRDSEASRLAELARRTDANAGRVVWLLASIALIAHDADQSRAIEKAWSLFVPEGAHHRSLATAFERAGDYESAHAWTRRWFELRPWDAEVAGRLVDVSVAIGRADVVADAVDRAVSSVHTWGALAGPIDAGLRSLTLLDPARAVATAKRLLELGAVQSGVLRDAMVDTAWRAGDSAFGVAVLESAQASGDVPDATVLMRVAELQRELGDADGEASALARAAHDPGQAMAILSRLETAPNAKTGDAIVWQLEARAAALEALGQERSREAAGVWLRAGAARWDLGGDRDGALDAWQRAAKIFGDRTYAGLGAALSRFAGDGAPAALGDHAARLAGADEASAMWVVAAALALRAGRDDATVRFAMHALEKAPARTDALLLIERASAKASDAAAVDKAYELVADAAKGRFGRRAAHYRAARTLEARGHLELAIVHATAAFDADPVDGAVLALMMRLAEKLDPTDVIQTLVRVSDREPNVEVKAFWLRCAARLATKHQAHARTALDLSLGSLLQSPCGEAAEIVEGAMRAVLATQPDDTDILQMRLARAARAMSSELDGPRGARVAVALACLSAELLRAAPLAWTWVNAAFACSGDVDEYAKLEPFASVLALDSEGGAAFVDAVLERARGFGGTTGPALFRIASAVAAAMGDSVRRDAVEAASRAASADVDVSQSEVDVFGDLMAEGETDAREALERPALPIDDEQPLPLAEEAEAAQSELPAEVEDIDPLRRAANLEAVGEVSSAIELLEADAEHDNARQATVDPHLRRLYALAGRNTELRLVLARMAERAPETRTKLRHLTELASLAEAQGDTQGALTVWDQVAELDPTHAEAAAFLERQSVEAGDYDRLARLLGRRADAADEPSDKRALRLRRAMLLEHRLHRADQAAQELEALLVETGEDQTVLRARAEIAIGASDERTAAQYWLRAAKASLSPADAATNACKAAAVFLGMGHERAARDALALAGPVRSPEVLALVVELERISDHPVALAAALDELATASHADDAKRSSWLMEAAEISVASGHVDLAVERASRAERLAPDEPHLVLRRVLVDYRVSGLGNRAEVAAMLARLEAIAERMTAEDFGLHAFLSAEAIEALSGKEAAYRLLVERRDRAPSDPLLALGLAERLAAAGRMTEALPLFDVALAAGDLGVLRTRAQVAFAAARTALNAGGPVLAAPYIAEVQKHPEAAELADRLRREAAEPAQVTDEMRKQLERVARESVGVERAKALRQIARTWAARGTRAAMAEADAYYAEAMAAAGSDPAIRTQIETERDAFRGRAASSERPPAVRASARPPETKSYPPPLAAGSPSTAPLAPRATEGPRDSAPPDTRSYPPPPIPRASTSPPGPLRASARPPAPPPLTPGDVATRPASPPAPTPLAPAVTFGRPSELPPPRERSNSGPSYSIVEPRTPKALRSAVSDNAEEKKLFGELAHGDVMAGDRLAELIEQDGGRAHDLVAVRRRQVVLEPANLRLLGMLRDAALSDHDRPHALAVEHVIDVLSGSPIPVQAPQTIPPDEPDRLHAMLSRGVHTEATELFAHVWESAPHVFARDPAAFGVTGLERVVIGAPTAVGRAYAFAARALGLVRVPVFQKRTPGPQTMAVALLQTPAVVIAGEVREDTPELIYRVASMLAATLPGNVMLFGMTGTAVKQLMHALMAAFGPPEASRGRESESAILAGELWRALPGRVQRRMQQILKESPFVYEEIWARALQSSRRAGLFVVADLRVALHDVMRDPGVQERIEPSQDALRSLCQLSTSAADLVRFATSVEYAQARWRDDVPRRSMTGPGM